MNDSENWDEELRRAKEGNQEALGKIFEKLFPRLVVYAGRYFHCLEQRKDVSQDALLKVVLGIHKFCDFEHLHRSALLVTKRDAINILKTQSRIKTGIEHSIDIPEMQTDQVFKTNLDPFFNHPGVNALHNCKKELDDDDQELIEHHFNRESNDKIARTLNKTPGYVAVRVHRIRKQLKDCIKRRLVS